MTEDCTFYHSIDLPNETVVGDWDLRPTIDAYLGNYDFAGKRVLDVGTAGGYLAFEAERRGASEVVAFDLANVESWDILPGSDPQTVEDFRREFYSRRRGFWYAHRALNSRVQLVEGTLAEMPDMGHFDVAILGMILPHIRDPLGALATVASRADALVITQQMPQREGPWAYFMPTTDNRMFNAWWVLTPDCFKRYLSLLGFEVTHMVTERHICNHRGDTEDCTALVAQRHSASPK